MQLRSIIYFKIKRINKEYYSKLVFGILTSVLQQEIIISQPLPNYATAEHENLNKDKLKFHKQEVICNCIMNTALMTINLLKERDYAINRITQR